MLHSRKQTRNQKIHRQDWRDDPSHQSWGYSAETSPTAEGYFSIPYKGRKGAERLSGPHHQLLISHNCQAKYVNETLRTDRRTLPHHPQRRAWLLGLLTTFCYQLRKQNLVAFLFSAQMDQRANFLHSWPFYFSLYSQSTEMFSTSSLKPRGPVFAFCSPYTLY